MNNSIPREITNEVTKDPIMIEAIFGIDQQFGIGESVTVPSGPLKLANTSVTNTIPWRIKEDMNYFRDITTNHIIMMGRNTWESLGSRPLKNRIHIIFSNSNRINNFEMTNPEQGIYYFSSLFDFYTFWNTQHCPIDKTNKKIFCIGGIKLLNSIRDCQNLFSICRIYLTLVPHSFPCDIFFPKAILTEYTLSHAENKILSTPQTYTIMKQDRTISKTINKITFLTYDKNQSNIKHPERVYLDLINNVLENGVLRRDRTAIGTKSIFGYQMRIPIQHAFPLLTSKRMFWKGIVEELLWFLRGDTDVRILQEKGVHIWDGNTTPEYLETRGLSHYETIPGECGPIYGFQFRHFGAQYKTCHDDYNQQGYDQVAEVLRLIREEPTSRRIMISLWNPPDLDKQILPPCHVLYQFYVNEEERTLSCSMYQRSGDIGLGIPFNIASASLMTYIFAHLTGLQPGELIHTIGDAHIYQNHLDIIEEQLLKKIYPWPKLVIKPRSTITNEPHTRIEDFGFEDFELMGYISEEPIKMKMVA